MKELTEGNCFYHSYEELGEEIRTPVKVAIERFAPMFSDGFSVPIKLLGCLMYLADEHGAVFRSGEQNYLLQSQDYIGPGPYLNKLGNYLGFELLEGLMLKEEFRSLDKFIFETGETKSSIWDYAWIYRVKLPDFIEIS